MSTNKESGWLIERHVNSELRYWDGRRIGDASFVASADAAVRFARECDAAVVLAWCFEGNGRVAEHVWSEATEPKHFPSAEPAGWKPANEHPPLFTDGDQYLVALQVRDQQRDATKCYWEYSVVRVRCDESYFAVELDGESWGWEWSDVEYYVKLSEFRIQPLAFT